MLVITRPGRCFHREVLFFEAREVPINLVLTGFCFPLAQVRNFLALDHWQRSRRTGCSHAGCSHDFPIGRWPCPKRVGRFRQVEPRTSLNHLQGDSFFFVCAWGSGIKTFSFRSGLENTTRVAKQSCKQSLKSSTWCKHFAIAIFLFQRSAKWTPPSPMNLPKNSSFRTFLGDLVGSILGAR